MKKIALFFFSAFLFIACNEDEKIASLNSDIKTLEGKLQELSLERDELQKADDLILTSETVSAGEGLFQVLSKMGIDANDRGAIVIAIQDSVELSKMRVGQVFHALRTGDGSVKAFRYATNPATAHMLFKENGAYRYERIDKPVVHRQSIFEGSLKPGSTLDGMLRGVGIPGRMVGVVSGVLQCKVAFQQAQPGDRFRILLEDIFYQDSIWIGGKVLYAEFDGRTVGHHEAFLYEDPDPKSSYNAHYTESGEALVFDGLRYPLDRLHITSPYGTRIHPVTGQRKSHDGIDYGSPTGTPIHAVAEGNVMVSAYDEYSGNKVAIKHRDGTSSWYLHMSVRGVSVGTHVVAGQVIGKVGATGRVTGPHLHFGFKDEKGRWMNPQKKTMIATPKLQGERLARLQKQAKEIRSAIEKTAAVTPKKTADSEILVRSRDL